MADYYPLLARAVAALPNSSPEMRTAIYERARKALIGQLQSLDPPAAPEHLAAESKALDDAIARLEAELAAEPGAPPPPRPAPPAATPAPPAPAATKAPAPAEPPAAPPAAPSTPAPAAPPAPAGAPPRPATAAPPPRPLPPPPPMPGGASAPMRPVPPPAPGQAPPRPIPPPNPASSPASPSAARPGSAPPPPPRPAPPLTPPGPAPAAGAAPPPPLAQPPAPVEPPAPAPEPPREEARPSARRDAAAEFDEPLRGRTPRDERDGPPAVAARAPASRGAPKEVVRPVAPTRPETGRVVSRQVMIWIPLVLLIGAGIGFAAWRLRVPQEEFAKPRASVENAAQPQGSAKINERAGAPGAAPTAPASPAPQPQRPQQAQAPAQQQAAPQQPAQQQRAPAEQAAPVAQRAAILVQASVSDQQNVETHIGTTVWRLEESRRPNAGGLPAVRADVDIAAVGLRLVFLIEKNNDPTLRASHMLTFRFLPQESSPLPAIAEMGSPQMRNESAPAVEPLMGAQAKITDNIYIVALNADPTFSTRNIETMKTRGWFDFPIRLMDGRIAKITIEKGQPGDRLLNQAIDQWHR